MLLCHDDYLARPDALQLADRALDENPDVPAVYCNLAYVNAAKRPLSTRYFPRGRRFSAEEAGRETLRTGRNMFGIPLGVRRSALERCATIRRFTMRWTWICPGPWRADRCWPISPSLAGQPLSRRQHHLDPARPVPHRVPGPCEKYAVPLGPMGETRLSARLWAVNQQKKVFGLYGRAVEWLG